MREMIRRFFVLFILAATVVAGLAACSSDKEGQIEEPADSLYQKASKVMDGEDYKQATKYFDEVERQHPYSEWATQAQLMSAFASYKDQRYDEAIIALDRYIELHPGNDDVDYAYYLKALCYYEQISDIRRDQEMTQMALKAMETLINRFPESKYAREAALKRDLTLDHLAGKEMEIGRYYLNKNEINAAINRFQTVVRDYQTTTHVPEALHRLVESYLILGLTDQAVRVASVLGYNYPGSKWYQDSYALLDPASREKLAAGRSWMDRTVDSLLKR